MIVKTLNGFAILDIIFGLVTLCFIVSNVTGDSIEGLLTKYYAKFGKSTEAKANGHAPAKGAGKRDIPFNTKPTHSLIPKRLAIERIC